MATSAAVNYCFISSDVFYVCQHHALSTEVEEVMGLLIGYTDPIQKHCHVTHTMLLQRLDKRKDRVEISPELLASSITECDKLNAARKTTGNDKMTDDDVMNSDLADNAADEGRATPQELRVVGWYHSHPHITIFPSEVDLRTQEQYQSGADPMWIGLIFGVYNSEESTGVQKFQYIAFQSLYKSGGGLQQALIPVLIKPKNKPPTTNSVYRSVAHPNAFALENVAKTLEILLSEECEAYAKRKCEIEALSIDCLASLQLASVFCKNICKIIRQLASPSIDVLQHCAIAADDRNGIDNNLDDIASLALTTPIDGVGVADTAQFRFRSTNGVLSPVVRP